MIAPISQRISRKWSAYPLLFWAALFCFTFPAAIAQRSVLPVQDFPAEQQYLEQDLGAGPQTFRVIRDAEGRIYCHNVSGILVFDGHHWMKVRGLDAPENVSFANAASGSILLGCRNDFGHIAIDSLGFPEFRSLKHLVSDDLRSNLLVTSVVEIDGRAYYQNRNELFRWDGDIVEVIAAGGRLRRVFSVEQEIYAICDERGLLKYENEKLNPVKGAKAFAGLNVKGLEKGPDPNSLLVVTYKQGLFLYQGSELKPIDGPASELISESGNSANRCYNSTTVSGSIVALATRTAGVLLINRRGELIQQINSENGLVEDKAINVIFQPPGGIWVSYGNGFAWIPYPFRYQYQPKSEQFPGQVRNFNIQNDDVIVGTQSGLYLLNEAEWLKPIPNLEFPLTIPASLPLAKDDSRFLIATDRGLFATTGLDPARQLDNRPWISLAPSPQKDDQFWLGGKQMLQRWQYAKDLWAVDSLAIPDFDVEQIQVDQNGDIWLAENQLALVEQRSTGLQATLLDSSMGWSLNMAPVNLIKYDGKMLFGTTAGTMEWDKKSQRLKPSTALPKMISKKHLWDLQQVSADSFWAIGDDLAGLATRSQNGTWTWDTTALKPFPRPSLRAVQPLPGGKALLGGDKGIFLLDAHIKEPAPKPYPAFFRKITLGGDSLIALTSQNPQFSASFGGIRFDYSALSFPRPEAIEYSWQLEGYKPNWSTWNAQAHAEFTNLSGGDYTFRVKARNVMGQESEMANYSFRIAMAWYLRTWAFVLYGLIFIGLTLLVTRMRTRQLVKAKERLEGIVQERTAQIEEEKRETEVQRDRAEESERVKKRFFANMTHELRTPLTLILGPVAQMQQRQQDAGTKNQLNLIQRNGNKLLRLINQLLDISKIESERMVLNPVRVDLVGFCKEAVDNFRTAAVDRGIEMNFHCEKNNIPADIDPEKIEKVLFNLLSNALKFTPAGGRVDLSLAETENAEPPQIQISVKDTGRGIPGNDLTRVFDRFYQSEHRGSQHGTGIGLALSRELVTLHGGEITAQSIVDVGSEFSFWIPQTQEGSTAATPQATADSAEIYLAETPQDPDLSAAPTDAELTAEKAENVILVVEDNADVRQYIVSCIPDEYQIVQAENGRIGQQKAAEIVPDLIVTDIMMPEMDGYQMAAALKKSDQTSHIPIVFLSSKAEVESKLKGLETGAEAYLTKPFNPDELQIRIRKLIEMRQVLREKYRSEVLLKPQAVEATSMEEAFLLKVKSAIEEELSNEQFAVEDMANAAGMSKVQFHRKFKALAGETPNRFLRSYRLQRAKTLLEQRSGNVADIAFQTGFSSPAYFSKCFMDEFGVTPSSIKEG